MTTIEKKTSKKRTKPAPDPTGLQDSGADDNSAVPAQIELRGIETLVPYARNSRTHSDAQIAELAASIDEFGLVGGIVVRDGVIAKGHGTLQGCIRILKAGKSLYPAPGRSGGARPYPDGQIPVIDASGWSDAQFRAFVIADNNLALNADWNYEMLAVELDDLRDMDFDLNLLGFDQQELNDMIGTANVAPLDGMPELPSGDRAPFQQMTFTLHDDQAEQVKSAIAAAKAMGEFFDTGNENSNGNALARICETFLGTQSHG